ncbi:MAG: hypothetical protein KatS3mg017_0596 [Fimbriimonadales bacterium]|nr:MAG: hypothetical protein KatS3mg017_0596 [Fimbriimonadales bacterium]
MVRNDHRFKPIIGTNVMERIMNQVSRLYANRRERRREETRQRLIQAALALMHEKPFDQVTVEEITERADVAKGTFFTYFPTKEHLLQAYIRDMTDEVYEFLESLQPEQAPSQWEVLRQVMLFIAQRDARSQQITRSMMNVAMQSDALRQMLVEILQEATEYATRGFEWGQQRGEFRTDVPPETLAHQAVRLYRLCQMEWLMERENDPLEHIVLEVLEFYKPAFLATSRSTDSPVRDNTEHPRSTDSLVRADTENPHRLDSPVQATEVGDTPRSTDSPVRANKTTNRLDTTVQATDGEHRLDTTAQATEVEKEASL